MVNILNDTFKQPNIEINNIDFLKVDIEKLVREKIKEVGFDNEETDIDYTKNM